MRARGACRARLLHQFMITMGINASRRTHAICSVEDRFGRLAHTDNAQHISRDSPVAPCYHPLFDFNQFGDLGHCSLRRGNVHSADGRDAVPQAIASRSDPSGSAKPHGVSRFADFSAWLLFAGLVLGALAAIAGLVDFLSNRLIRALPTAWLHMAGNIVVMLLALFNSFVHSRDAWTSVVPTGLILSALTVVVMLFTGWLGGSMVYRHRVGVAS